MHIYHNKHETCFHHTFHPYIPTNSLFDHLLFSLISQIINYASHPLGIQKFCQITICQINFQFLSSDYEIDPSFVTPFWTGFLFLSWFFSCKQPCNLAFEIIVFLFRQTLIHSRSSLLFCYSLSDLWCNGYADPLLQSS